jgi:hypothetical protein
VIHRCTRTRGEFASSLRAEKYQNPTAVGNRIATRRVGRAAVEPKVDGSPPVISLIAARDSGQKSRSNALSHNWPATRRSGSLASAPCSAMRRSTL